MQTMDLNTLLTANTYPGRGIVLGLDDTGKKSVAAYFIMGRSENSRNRVFVEKDGGIITRAFDESKMVDPSLIIYAPVRVFKDQLIVTNGDQTDTVYNYLKKGYTFEAALRTRCFEPDAPNYTPRISGLVTKDKGHLLYKLSILKSDDGDPCQVQRFFYEYTGTRAGLGHFIHTYRCDGSPIPSFAGEPEKVAICGDIDTFTEQTWNSLNADNKVSLFVRYTDLVTGACETRIVNKNH